METNRLFAGLVLTLSIALTAWAVDPEDCALEELQREAASLDENWGAASCVGTSLPFSSAGAEAMFLAVDARPGTRPPRSLEDINTAGTDLTLSGADGLSDF